VVITTLNELEGLLFDFDGTLAKPAIDFAYMRQVVRAIAERYGVCLVQLGDMPALEIAAAGRAQLAVHGKDLVKRFDREVERALLDIELEAAERTELYPEVPRMLDLLAAMRYRIGIVTRNSRAALKRVLRRVPLRHHLLLTRDDVPSVKPDPAHLKIALQALHLSASKAAMVGDHPMDILAGKRAGVRTVAVLASGTQVEAFEPFEPDLIVEQVTDLLPVLWRDGGQTGVNGGI